MSDPRTAHAPDGLSRPYRFSRRLGPSGDGVRRRPVGSRRAGGDDQHRARRLSHDVVRDAAEEQAFDAAIAVCAHHDQVGVALLSETHDLGIRAPDDDVCGDR